MMKKKLFFLLVMPLILSGLAGCVKYNGRGKSRKTSSIAETSSVVPDNSKASSSANNQGKSSQIASDELPVGTDVKVYLVFGEYGLYKNNPVNTSVESLYLEHTMELEAKVGDRLPTRDDVTSSVSGSVFVAWTSYNNDGKLTEYTKVPGYQNKILYASFSSGSSSTSSNPSGGSSSTGGSSQSGSSQTPVTNKTYTVTDLPDWLQNDGCVIFAWVWGASDPGSWKSLTFGSNGSSATFTVPSDLTGFLLARCASGTTTPNWDKSDDGVGRVYNKTNNIDCTTGVYSYACSSWVNYPN